MQNQRILCEVLLDAAHANAEIGLVREEVNAENIAAVLAREGAPRAPTLLSIDIDCNDWHVMRAIWAAGYRPVVVVAEHKVSWVGGGGACVFFGHRFRWHGGCRPGSAKSESYS